MWIFSIRYYSGDPYATPSRRECDRRAVVGPACVATVEAALKDLPEEVATVLRSLSLVRAFVEGNVHDTGHYESGTCGTDASWVICIGPVHEVLRD